MGKSGRSAVLAGGLLLCATAQAAPAVYEIENAHTAEHTGTGS